jgi:hypothetical protein
MTETRFDDPRTLIASVIGSEVSNSRTVITLTLEIADVLAQWLTQQAQHHELFDERSVGYQDFAQRLIER